MTQAEDNAKRVLRRSMELNGDEMKAPAEGDRRREAWRFTKQISLGGLAALAIQLAGVIWWAQGVTKDGEAMRRRVENIEGQRVGERITALESQMVDSKGSLIRIESKLDRLVETRK